jgi:hypothetical protein
MACMTSSKSAFMGSHIGRCGGRALRECKSLPTLPVLQTELGLIRGRLGFWGSMVQFAGLPLAHRICHALHKKKID